MSNQAQVDLEIDLSVEGGILAHHVEVKATVAYDIEEWHHGEAMACSWTLIEVRAPSVKGAITPKDWIWPMLKEAIEEHHADDIRDEILDQAEWDRHCDEPDRDEPDLEPRANLIDLKMFGGKR